MPVFVGQVQNKTKFLQQLQQSRINVATTLGISPTHTPTKKPSNKNIDDDSPNRTSAFKEVRTKRMWTDDETDLLRQGLEMYGHNWKQIATHFPVLSRSPVQLKDRARNVRNILTNKGQELGPWAAK